MVIFANFALIAFNSTKMSTCEYVYEMKTILILIVSIHSIDSMNISAL